MFCQVGKKELFGFKALQKRLKNRQSNEPSRIQGKIRAEGIIHPELSTRSVDAFYLAPSPVTLQHGLENQTR